MKKTVYAAIAAIVITAGTGFAQMSGGTMGAKQHGQPERSGTEQGRMMNPEMMNDMSGVMNHMMEMMRMMSHTMSHRTITEHLQMADMSRIMEEMSGMMHEMSQKMAQGSMSPADSKQMQERMRSMQERMKALQKSAK